MRFHLIVASRYENNIKEWKKHARIKNIYNERKNTWENASIMCICAAEEKKSH